MEPYVIALIVLFVIFVLGNPITFLIAFLGGFGGLIFGRKKK